MTIALGAHPRQADARRAPAIRRASGRLARDGGRGRAGAVRRPSSCRRTSCVADWSRERPAGTADLFASPEPRSALAAARCYRRRRARRRRRRSSALAAPMSCTGRPWRTVRQARATAAAQTAGLARIAVAQATAGSERAHDHRARSEPARRHGPVEGHRDGARSLVPTGRSSRAAAPRSTSPCSAPATNRRSSINVPVTAPVARYRVGFRSEDGRVIGHVDRRTAATMA